MPRVHYDSLAQAVPQAKETTFVSEWFQQRPELPVRHVVSRAVLASGCIMPAFTGHEVNNVSEWIGSRPDLPTRHVQSVTPSGSQQPTFVGHEIVLPDKFFHQQPDPSNVVAVLSVVPSGAVQSAFTGTEVINLDKWWHQHPEPIRLVSPLGSMPSGGIMPAFTGHEIVLPDKFSHQQPDPSNIVAVRSVVPSGAVQSAFTGAEVVNLDKWWHQQPEPIRLVSPLGAMPSGGVIPAYTGPEIVFADKWTGTRPDGALRPQQRLVDLTQWASPLIGLKETILADKWLGSRPDPVHSLVASIVPSGTSQPTTTPVAAVVPSIAAWQFQPPIVSAAPRAAVPSGAVLTAVVAGIGGASIAAWQFQPPMISAAPRSAVPSGSVLTAVVPAPSVAGWIFQPPITLPAPQYQRLGLGFSVGPVSLAAEAVSVDRWQGYAPIAFPPPPRITDLSVSVEPFAGSFAQTPLSWWRQPAEPIRSSLSPNSGTSAVVPSIAATPPVVVTDKYLALAVTGKDGKRRLLIIRVAVPQAESSLRAAQGVARIFDATGFAGGITAATLPKFSWVSSASIGIPPAQADVNAVADAAMNASGILGLDLEGAGTDTNYQRVGTIAAAAAAANQAQIIDWAHARQPGLRAGLIFNFPTTVDGFEHIGQLDVANWQAVDDSVAAYFVNRCDFGAMLVYHAYGGTANFDDFAEKAAAELRRKFPNKPIYAFVTPFLIIAATNNPALDQATWGHILDKCLSLFDAILIGAGWGWGAGEAGPGAPFNPNVFWWSQVASRM